MRSYPLNYLYYSEFEELVVLICDRILGSGTSKFSTGKDGGRDAFFSGRANRFPSETKPWEGKFIIQAKHTGKVNASCSDSDFSTILKEEVNRNVFKFQDNGKADYYLLFTNRKLSGLKDEQISDFLDIELNIPNRIFGEERIQLWLRDYPDIAKKLNLNRLFIPLKFYEKDLKDVIVTFAKRQDEISKQAEKALQYTNMEKKNQLNQVSEEYFKYMQSHSLKHFTKIGNFLKDPRNKHYKNMYKNTVADLKSKIIINRNDFGKFDELFDEIYEEVFSKNQSELKDIRRLIWVFLHYMYFCCDIGSTE
jgi:hypothetical protein